MLGNLQTEFDANVLEFLDKDMVAIERRPKLCNLEMIHCPVCDYGMSTLRAKTGITSTRSNVRCKRCQCINKSGQWTCPCGITWPKCDIHRKLATPNKCTGQNRRKNTLLRHFGTNKPPPNLKRRRPGERSASEPMHGRYESFVGHLNPTQRANRPQVCHIELKRPKSTSDVVLPDAVDPNSDDGFETEMSHKRQPDTEAYDLSDPEPKRPRINLPAGSKLARRFPQHVRSDTANHGPAVVNAVSNKRRRKLPFKMKGSDVGQCADVNTA